MKNLSALVGLVLILSACGNNASPTVEAITATKQDTIFYPQQSKVIGTDDRIKVKKDGSNVDTNLRGYLDAFGIISLGDGVCSGTHIGNGFVLTAGHCIIPEGQTGVVTNQDCSKIKVYWGYRGSPDTGSPKPIVTLASQCTTVVYAELDNDRDFAIFKVDQAPSVSIPISKSTPSSGTKVTVFGYPQGRPLEWSQYCQVVSVANSTTRFEHQCDTEPGNSGSSIIALNSSGNPMVVGIHDASTQDDYNLGTYFSAAMITMKAKTGFDIANATAKFF